MGGCCSSPSWAAPLSAASQVLAAPLFLPPKRPGGGSPAQRKADFGDRGIASTAIRRGAPGRSGTPRRSSAVHAVAVGIT